MKSKLNLSKVSLNFYSTVFLVIALLGSPQIAADFDFYSESPDIFTQLELDKPRLKKDLIDRERSRTRDRPRARIRFSLDQAASRARSQSGGRVIKAQTRWRNGQPVHIIRILSDDKRVKTYSYDGVSGRRL